MVSTELLRRYSFFALLSPEQLMEVAMIADEIEFNPNDVVFNVEQDADKFYLLVNGAVDMFTESFDPLYKPDLRRNYMVGMVNPGEVFGVSAMIEPFKYTAMAVATEPVDAIVIDAVALRNMLETDRDMGYVLLQQVNFALMERLNFTRIQLAAAQ